MRARRNRIQRPLLALSIALAAALAASASAGAQEEGAAPTPAAERAEPALPRATPREAVRAFLEAGRARDWRRAARVLDLAPVPEAERARRGPELARELKTVLDRRLWVDLEQLSAEPEGSRDDGLPASRERVGTIEGEAGRRAEVLLERVREEEERVWKFAAATVAEIPELYERYGSAPLVEALPRPLREIRVLEIALWQWIALALLVLLAGAAAWLGDVILVHVLGPVVARSRTRLDDRLLSMTVGPVRLLLGIASFTAGLVPLDLAVPAQDFFHGLALLLSVAGVAWLVFRLVDLLGAVTGESLRERGQEPATHLIPLGRKVLKVVVAVIAFLAALDSFGFDVTALVAGLGVGGIAVALAAQKTIEHFFGGLSVLADRPVQPGEFCRYGDKLGVVEEVGLRSTRVRSLERTIVTVPNAEFSTLQIENFARRDAILLSPRLGLRYETSPDQLRWVLQRIREMLYAHPMVSPDPARIRFAGFGAYSLDIDIWAYTTTADWNEYLAVREDVYLRIMDIVAESGTGFAFPSQTTYLAKDGGLDAEGTERVEAQVAEWREQRQLMLPTFPPERIAELDDTLDWPPEGSAARGGSGEGSTP